MSNCDRCDTRFICGYHSELNQVVLNILLNAKDAICEKQKRTGVKEGAINISFARPKDTKTVIISISDNGGGMKAGVADKIFEPYFTTKEQGKGVGIGLYMSKVIVEQNFKGKIGIKNIPNGAEVTIELPLAIDA
jgi:C4-dicarboxylate-specific signal transduction histidine kinase